MIKYALKCEVDHGFEAWFSSSDSFDEQAAKGLVECPMCGSTRVTKAIMAPMVRTSKEDVAPADMRQAVAEMLHKLRKHVEDTHTYVGGAFANEARDMHQGLTPERPLRNAYHVVVTLGTDLLTPQGPRLRIGSRASCNGGQVLIERFLLQCRRVAVCSW